MDTPGRVRHSRLGCGSIVESKTTVAGNAAVLVKFDNGEDLKLVLQSHLKPILPEKPTRIAPAEKTHHKAPVEAVSDRLLVEALDDADLETEEGGNA